MPEKLKNPYTGWKIDPDKKQTNLQLRFLTKAANWDQNIQSKYQLKKLRNVVEYAYENVEYYRELLKEVGMKPADFQTFADFKHIPLLNKKNITDNYNLFLSRKFKTEDLKMITSGGSTGNPMRVYFDESFFAKDRANTLFYLSQNNHDPYFTKSVRIHGDPIPQANIDKGNYTYFISENKLIVSSQHLFVDSLRSIVNQIDEFNPRYIHAYPSAIYNLAKLMNEARIYLKIELDCIYCDSENLYPGQRNLIENTFKCKVIAVYGHTEGAMLGISLNNCTNLHMLSQVGYVELLDENFKDINESEKEGEVVVTGFNNLAFPIIRYRTSDRATIGICDSLCKLKNHKVFSRINGRDQDYAYNKNKERVAIAPGLFDYHVNWESVSKFLIIQEKIGELKFFIALNKSLNLTFSSVRDKLMLDLKLVFGEQFDFEFLESDSIETLTSRGKQRYFIQSLGNPLI
jgi:phenylacetate-CoA ligase